MAIWFLEVEMTFDSAADIQGGYRCGDTVDSVTEEGATLLDTV